MQPGRWRNSRWLAAILTHWAMIRGAFPVSSQVVLVPDAATYLDELGKWTKHNRRPVLLEDDAACIHLRRLVAHVTFKKLLYPDQTAPGSLCHHFQGNMSDLSVTVQVVAVFGIGQSVLGQCLEFTCPLKPEWDIVFQYSRSLNPSSERRL